MKRKIAVVMLAVSLSVGTAAAQLGSGVVFDPTNYKNALLRYYQLQQHLAELQKSYSQLVMQYNLAMRMAQQIENMPARYKALFSQWRNTFASDRYGNVTGWVNGINSGLTSLAGPGYGQATTTLLPYDSGQLSGMNSGELARVRSQYATVELTDGANTTAMETIGSIRSSAQDIQAQIGNLEGDSFSDDPDLNTEVSVLNKINAAGVLTLRTLQDSNKLLASMLEEQTILSKQQRESTANAINADIERQAGVSSNINQVTGTLTSSLESFRMQ
jgi:hypothetical protein